MCSLPEAQAASAGRQVWGRQALTRPQVPMCQAWSLRREQSSCTQGSVRGGWSCKGHAVAGSSDPSALRQVTLLLRTPAPQLTEHCKDQAVSGGLSSPRGATLVCVAGGPVAWHGGQMAPYGPCPAPWPRKAESLPWGHTAEPWLLIPG